MQSNLAKLRNARSKKDFPGISLEDDEYVEISMRCSRIIPILIWTGTLCAGIIGIAILILFVLSGSFGAIKLDGFATGLMTLVILAVLATIFIAALISTRVYNGNRLYVTNKRLIQQQMLSLFNASTNVIDLVSIEDVSFKQKGLLEHIFRIGTLRMSTVGDETTYTFKNADAPTGELKTITHLVHTAKEKNGKK